MCCRFKAKPEAVRRVDAGRTNTGGNRQLRSAMEQRGNFPVDPPSAFFVQLGKPGDRTDLASPGAGCKPQLVVELPAVAFLKSSRRPFVEPAQRKPVSPLRAFRHRPGGFQLAVRHMLAGPLHVARAAPLLPQAPEHRPRRDTSASVKRRMAK